MALIKCPECGKEVSDTCSTCIHCGYKLKKESAFDIPDVTYTQAYQPIQSSSSNKGSWKKLLRGIVSGIMFFLITGIMIGAYYSAEPTFGDAAKMLLVMAIVSAIIGVITIIYNIFRFIKKR